MMHGKEVEGIKVVGLSSVLLSDEVPLNYAMMHGKEVEGIKVVGILSDHML